MDIGSLAPYEETALMWTSAQVVYDIARKMQTVPDDDRLAEAIHVMHEHQLTVAHDGVLNPQAAYNVGVNVGKILGG